MTRPQKSYRAFLKALFVQIILDSLLDGNLDSRCKRSNFYFYAFFQAAHRLCAERWESENRLLSRLRRCAAQSY